MILEDTVNAQPLSAQGGACDRIISDGPLSDDHCGDGESRTKY